MKNLFLFIFIISLSSEAQNRYYPTLSNLVELEQQSSSIPKELKYLENWYGECIDNIFYKDLQQSGNPRNSASFKSLGLIFRKKNEFEFLKSGLIISFDTNSKKNIESIRVSNNHYWKGRSYGIEINLDDYVPENDFYRFLILRRLQSLTKEQTIAHFINTFTKPSKNQNSVEKLIEDINKKNEFNIIYKKDMTLKELSKQIKSELPPKSNFYWAVYNTYIKAETVENTRKNMSRYFRGFSIYNIEETINKTILPNGDFIFSNKKTKITLPKKYFKYTSEFSNEPVNFYVYKIEYDLNYDYVNKNYDLSIKLYPKKDSGLKENFTFKHKYRDVFKKNKEKVKKIEVNKTDIEYVEIKFRPDSFSISIRTDMQFLKLFKDFKTN